MGKGCSEVRYGVFHFTPRLLIGHRKGLPICICLCYIVPTWLSSLTPLYSFSFISRPSLFLDILGQCMAHSSLVFTLFTERSRLFYLKRMATTDKNLFLKPIKVIIRIIIIILRQHYYRSLV